MLFDLCRKFLLFDCEYKSGKGDNFPAVVVDELLGNIVTTCDVRDWENSGAKMLVDTCFCIKPDVDFELRLLAQLVQD